MKAIIKIFILRKRSHDQRLKTKTKTETETKQNKKPLLQKTKTKKSFKKTSLKVIHCRNKMWGKLLFRLKEKLRPKHSVTSRAHLC